uniref:Sesquipedalian-1 n=1 Tax=Cacopsylla melanoneura TaxID=428564 RepID=A0A8D8ZTK8_9HEMI
MKINDKNLCSFATSMTPVDKEGYLTKRGDINKAFQKRWFVLKGNLLFYFEKRHDKEPVGVIILEGCTIELADNTEDAFSFKIMFHGPGNRSYILGAENQESMEQWMKSLACASYDYMKLMVAELQRQLDELDGTIVSDSPQVPPRRQNPFNRHHVGQQPQSLQHSITMPDIPPHNVVQINKPEPINTNTNRNKITFRELHNAYGRSILRDRTEFRYQLKQKTQTSLSPSHQQPLLISCKTVPYFIFLLFHGILGFELFCFLCPIIWR